MLIGTITTIICFGVLNAVTDWPTWVIFAVSAAVGLLVSLIDLLLIALVEGVTAIFDGF